MEYRKFDAEKLIDTYVLRLDRGDEIIASITALCQKEKIKLGWVTGLGAADHAVIGLYDVGERFYNKTELNGPMEITSLVGNITTKDGETYLHLHINLCDETMAVRGGHLNECRISATSEIIVRKLEGRVERLHDTEVTGLNIFKFI